TQTSKIQRIAHLQLMLEGGNGILRARISYLIFPIDIASALDGALQDQHDAVLCHAPLRVATQIAEVVHPVITKLQRERIRKRFDPAVAQTHTLVLSVCWQKSLLNASGHIESSIQKLKAT